MPITQRTRACGWGPTTQLRRLSGEHREAQTPTQFPRLEPGADRGAVLARPHQVDARAGGGR